MKEYKYSVWKTPEGKEVKVLFVMATQAEFGTELRDKGISPIFTGVGKIQAATNLSLFLASVKNKPDLVINIGTAGSQDLDINTVYMVSSSRNFDMNVSALGFPPGKTPFSPYPEQINLPTLEAPIPTASCYTTDSYNTPVPSKGAPLELEDMEFHAFLMACMGQNIPIIGLKAVSNNKETIHTTKQEWSDYCQITIPKFAMAVSDLENSVATGIISREKLLQMPPAHREAINNCLLESNATNATLISKGARRKSI